MCLRSGKTLNGNHRLQHACSAGCRRLTGRSGERLYSIQAYAGMAQAGQSQLAEVPTREQIQQDLEDNEKLIKAILENMNAGKLQACAGYQQKLQQNLMRLASIADAQPPPVAGNEQSTASAGQPTTQT